MRTCLLSLFFTGLLLCDIVAIIAFFVSPYKMTIFPTVGVLSVSGLIIAAFFFSSGRQARSRQDNL